MSSITLDLPDDLAERLRSLVDSLPRILELGLREVDASSQAELSGASDILEILATLPSPEQILALRLSPGLQERVRALLDKSRTTGLSPGEEEEWKRYEYLEHLVRLAKARAALKLQAR
jgi:hypothetical protein